jgi:hypothetical protein
MHWMPMVWPQQSAVVVHFSNSCEQVGWVAVQVSPPSSAGRQ